MEFWDELNLKYDEKLEETKKSLAYGNASSYDEYRQAVGLIEEAGQKGARLIVFPECWLPCFPYWSLDFTDEFTFMEIWARYAASSVEVPGRETEALCAAAKRAKAYVAMGINERDTRFKGRMYNAILYLSPSGTVMGAHRKICNTLQERFFHTPGGGGDNLKTIFKTEIGTIGGSICGEHTQHAQIYNWIMQGLEIHCSLWPGEAGLETAIDIDTRSLCSTAGAFGVAASAYFPEKDRPQNFYRNSRFSVPPGFCGGSGIINPFGGYVAGPVYGEETIVYGDIDLADIYKKRSLVNPTGMYDRSDIININVRQEPYQAIMPMAVQEAPLSPPEASRISELEAQVKRLEKQIAAFARTAKKDAKDKN